jgi:hypothetical protein
VWLFFLSMAGAFLFGAYHHFIVVSPNLPRSEKDDVGLAEKVIHCRNWGEALAELVGKNGPGTKVGVWYYSGGRSTANWSVISSRREPNRNRAAGRPPARPEGRNGGWRDGKGQHRTMPR